MQWPRTDDVFFYDSKQRQVQPLVEAIEVKIVAVANVNK